jgi:hypothetical protein
LLLTSIALLACKKEITPTNPCANNVDVLLPEEKIWIDYKKGDSISFLSSKKRTYTYKVTYYYLDFPYRADFCVHRYVNSQTAFNNREDKSYDRITGLTINYTKNSSSLSTTGKVENQVSFELYNEKAATGLFPSVSASSGGSCITLDKRDPSQCRSELIGKLTIREKVYENVYKQGVQPNPNIGATFLYVNRDNGILRIDFADGEVWEKAP